MSLGYRAISWNPQKRRYDAVVVTGVLLWLATFAGVTFWRDREATIETVFLRAFGTLALFLLHVVLSIGPLARLDRRFLPLLYNRRHLGVTMFLCALAHGVLAILQFHSFGELHPLVSVLVSNARYDSLAQFPFQPLGLAALLVLFLMAATSHDFWLRNLSAPLWKSLHMLVYFAWAAIVAHVALGALQAELHPAHAGLVGAGIVWILGLHLWAGSRERATDEELAPDAAGWVRACAPEEIREGHARVFTIAGERVALFRTAGKLAALSAVCQHQNGPLGEGRVVDGLVTCPWHGYQYRPACGRSPEPFDERVPVFRTRIARGVVEIAATPAPRGTTLALTAIDAPEEPAE